MKSLIIYAHPNPASFTNGLKNKVEEQLKACGHEVKIRDLYAENFNCVLSGSDLGGIYSGAVPSDIKIEQEYLTWADNYILIHPIWWSGLPAIIKGYIDRVLCYGFAYSIGATGVEGLLKGKKIVLLTPHGMPYEMYESMGMHKSFAQTQDIGIWQFCGVEVCKHFFFGMSGKQRAELEEYLKQVEEYFANF